MIFRAFSGVGPPEDRAPATKGDSPSPSRFWAAASCFPDGDPEADGAGLQLGLVRSLGERPQLDVGVVDLEDFGRRRFVVHDGQGVVVVDPHDLVELSQPEPLEDLVQIPSLVLRRKNRRAPPRGRARRRPRRLRRGNRAGGRRTCRRRSGDAQT